ncbi:hypothetical protein KJ934_02725 [Patescibacteria group bacterium]|nr:hypothetical protein [Patescibacteria group bacterium]MBU4353556.1 hypothetical protein [Patescibacteria group bacterium]
MLENKIEDGERKSATENFLRNINPEIWENLNNFSIEEQDKRWFELTQKHLSDYEKGDFKAEDFEREELELLVLNYLGAKNLSSVNPESRQRGFFSSPEKYFQKLEKFGNFVDGVKEKFVNKSKQSPEPFNILVSGIGISGKATLRTVLTKELSEKCSEQSIISWDRDYQKIFPPKWQGNANIIEDVHGLDNERDADGKLKRFDGSEGLPDGYDLVIYSLSPAVTYRQSLVKRGLSWLKIGKMDLTAPGKEYKEDAKEKIRETADELERTFGIGKSWFKEHLRILRELQKRGIEIAVVDPTQIFKELYGFEERPESAGQDFYSALEDALKK